MDNSNAHESLGGERPNRRIVQHSHQFEAMLRVAVEMDGKERRQRKAELMMELAAIDCAISITRSGVYIPKSDFEPMVEVDEVGDREEDQQMNSEGIFTVDDSSQANGGNDQDELDEQEPGNS
jgi:hypothetical protein